MKASEIAKIAQIASALEVSGYPKPGNVHRTRDYDDMEFEDFIISGIVIGDTIREACTDVDVDKYLFVNDEYEWRELEISS